MMVRNISVLVLVAVLAGIAIFQSLSQADELPTEHAPKVHFLAPEFTLEGLDGKTYSVGGKRDKAVLINFWASWCGPCHDEAPDLVRLYEEYNDRFEIYAINVTKEDTVKNAKAFVAQYEFTFPVLMDLDNEVASLYNIRGFPTNILVDENGVIEDIFPSMLLPNHIKKIERFLR